MSLPSYSQDATKICTLCEKNPSKYCCPRCEALYCSVKCYKCPKHFNCSEEFYKECITKELEGNEADEVSRKKMLEILTRVQDQDENFPQSIEQILAEIDENDIQSSDDSNIDTDDEQVDELKERIKGLNLNKADEVWHALTDEEKNEFAAMVTQGDIEKIMERWKPWWCYTKETKLVQEVGAEDEEDKDEMEAMARCPPILQVPSITELTSVKPAPTIKFNIINAIASFAYLMRYFNGDPDSTELSIHMMEICNTFNSDANFPNKQTAIDSIIQQIVQCEFMDGDKSNFETMKRDLILILNGPSVEMKSHYTKCALSQLHGFMKDSRDDIRKASLLSKCSGKTTEFSKKFPESLDYLPTIDMVKLRKAIKKLEYYLSYVNSYGLTNP